MPRRIIIKGSIGNQRVGAPIKLPVQTSPQRSLLTRLLWFGAIYVASVAAVGLVTLALRRVLVG